MYQRKSEGAFDDSPMAVLYQRHAHSILHYIHRYITSQEDADDLVLEVFLAALGNQVWINWNDEEQFAWLRSIAHHKAVDHLRRVARRPVMALESALDMLFEDDFRSPEQVALRNEDYAQLREHLVKLSDLQQEIVRLRFAYDLRTKEIAQMLNKSDNVVRVLLSRALNYLRTVYNQKEGS
jgi:RNA polymerase sigma-70 factor (ECF subfamily)